MHIFAKRILKVLKTSILVPLLPRRAPDLPTGAPCFVPLRPSAF